VSVRTQNIARFILSPEVTSATDIDTIPLINFIRQANRSWRRQPIILNNNPRTRFQRRDQRFQNLDDKLIGPVMQRATKEVNISVLDWLLLEEVMPHECNLGLYRLWDQLAVLFLQLIPHL
jgi:hypothetical protein